jgi:exodeoxyribonuclease V alpha subunit
VIASIDREEGGLRVDYDGRLVEYVFGDWTRCNQHIIPASIHKSRESEYPAVVILLTMKHHTLLERNLIFPAVTRGKKLVTIIGQTKTSTMAVKNRRSDRNFTNQAFRIAAG